VIFIIVGITFAVAIPLILAAFEIQSVQNAWKKGKVKMAEKRRKRKLKEMKPEDDEMPDFLKPNRRTVIVNKGLD